MGRCFLPDGVVNVRRTTRHSGVQAAELLPRRRPPPRESGHMLPFRSSRSHCCVRLSAARSLPCQRRREHAVSRNGKLCMMFVHEEHEERTRTHRSRYIRSRREGCEHSRVSVARVRSLSACVCVTRTGPGASLSFVNSLCYGVDGPDDCDRGADCVRHTEWMVRAERRS